MILGVPSAATRILAGLRSRWTMPAGGPRPSPGPASRPAGRPSGSQGVPSSLCVQAAAVAGIPARSRAARPLRRCRRPGRCSDAAAGRPPRPRRGSGAAAGAAWLAGQDHLERDQAIEAELPGLVDDAHAAAAQLAEDFIAGDVGAGSSRLSRRIATGGRSPFVITVLAAHRLLDRGRTLGICSGRTFPHGTGDGRGANEREGRRAFDGRGRSMEVGVVSPFAAGR